MEVRFQKCLVACQHAGLMAWSVLSGLLDECAERVEGIHGCHGVEVHCAKCVHAGVCHVACKEVELVRIGNWGTCRIRCRLAGLDAQSVEQLPCAMQCVGRDAGKLGHVDSVAAVRASGLDAMQEDDSIVPLADSDVEVRDSIEPISERSEFVIVGGEQRSAPAFSNGFRNRPCQRQPVKCACSPPDFIKYDEAAVGWRGGECWRSPSFQP